MGYDAARWVLAGLGLLAGVVVLFWRGDRALPALLKMTAGSLWRALGVLVAFGFVVPALWWWFTLTELQPILRAAPVLGRIGLALVIALVTVTYVPLWPQRHRHVTRRRELRELGATVAESRVLGIGGAILSPLAGFTILMLCTIAILDPSFEYLS